MPCRGCFGPTPDIHDQGAKFLAALGSVSGGKTMEEVRAFADSLEDLIGNLYRFSLPTSLLQRRTCAKEAPK
jgi:F420-non-reducing hydrogenase small subunit